MPVIIGIGGGHSGAGKTALACRILNRLPGWGAIKYTKTSLYASVTDDVRVLSEKGKDTRRLLDSGAEKVVWVRSPFYELEQILPTAVEMLSHLRGILVEGNSAVEVLKPDIVIFVSGSGEKMKEEAGNILRMANVVVFDGDPPPETPKVAKKFRRDEEEHFLKFILREVKKCEGRSGLRDSAER